MYRLISLIIIAAVLRLGLLGSYPPFLNVDEVSIGYNAYALLLSGRDQYQKTMPLVFQSLGDFKPPVYLYLTVPSVAVFGLTEFSVRFPSAVFSVLAVLLTYLVTYRITRRRDLALLAGPLLGLGLWAIYKKSLPKASFLVLLLLVPLLLVGGQSRIGQTLVTGDVEINTAISQSLGRIDLSRAWLVVWSVVNRYLQYFDPSFLFFRGLDLTLNQLVDAGVAYLIELPLFVVGLITVIRRRIFPKALWWWIVISPLPASLTLNDYHPIRSLALVLPLVIIIAVGLQMAWPKFKHLILLAYLVNFVFVADYYLLHSVMQKSDYSFDPSAQIARVALANRDKYSTIVIDPDFGKDGPTIKGVPDIYLLFYGRIRPQDYWNSITPRGFANFEFRHIDWKIEKATLGNLLIGSTWSLPEVDIPSHQILDKVYFANRVPAYLVVKTE
ncbi:MAG: hypothetical protein UX42_C0001G0108 [Microgenomates group bacterium GW2011_GWC1_46_20]|nr:MAG: hypothetical protein UX42_C0001G0108 [Microgenomates group bacterium GW2011_GWC1_46_20]